MKGLQVLPVYIILGALFLGACGIGTLIGSGNVVTETRPVNNFDAITFSGSGDVIITQGETESLKIEAEDNLIPRLRTEVRGHTLHIFLDPQNLVIVQPTRPIKYYVSMKDISSLDLSGSGTITSEKITSENLNINISGSGDTMIDELTTDKLDINISGSGKCLLKGQAPIQTLNISGSGNYNASDLVSREANINISGSGKVKVNAAERLNINMSGSGEVMYSGHPEISQKVTGSGRISVQ